MKISLFQNPDTLSLPPVSTLPCKEEVEVAWFRIAALIWTEEAPGFNDAYNAAAPETWGVAMEVPL